MIRTLSRTRRARVTTAQESGRITHGGSHPTAVVRVQQDLFITHSIHVKEAVAAAIELIEATRAFDANPTDATRHRWFVATTENYRAMDRVARSRRAEIDDANRHLGRSA